MRLVTALWFVAGSALAETCPAPLDDAALRDRLHEALSGARTHAAAGEAQAALWQVWLTAPDGQAQDLLDAGIAARETGDLERSRSLFGQVIAYCPSYAEGWNQRAFSAYLGRAFAEALPDLDEALRLDPRHLGALTGKALVLIELDRAGEALALLEQAAELNPFMMERLLIPGLREKLGVQEL